MSIFGWTIAFGWDEHAGLVCINNNPPDHMAMWSFHLFVQREHWVWGHEETQYDVSWGLGPLFRLGRLM